ncbi:MAG: ribosome biogenesis GTPase [Sphingobacteriales bacterium]|jgi:ribosome biogenesis GTPase
MEVGQVIKSTGSWYRLRRSDGEEYNGRLAGKIRQTGSRLTNPVVVGDFVDFQFQETDDAVVIEKVHKRKNYIVRKSPKLSSKYHVLASNLDQAVILFTCALPRTSFGFLDRFLITAEAYGIPAIIGINKIDLLDEQGMEEVEAIIETYNNLGYPSVQFSALNSEDLSELQAILKGKLTLLAGHSGAGKSTLINRLIPGKDIKTSYLSEASGKGVHTTTFAELHDLPEGGMIIDTPGIRELGIVDMKDAEISHYFPEMKELLGNCKFGDCLHIEEPDCAVREGFDEGLIAPTRYYSYMSILQNEDNRN